MKGRKILIAMGLPLLFLLQPAGAADMLVQTWDPDVGCEHTMTTNHFELAPGEKVELDLDLTGCTADELGMMLYFGYHTTKTRSRPLSAKNKIRLTVVDDQTGEEFVSDDGSVLIDVTQPGRCKLYAENMNRTKTLKIRLRSSSGL